MIFSCWPSDNEGHERRGPSHSNDLLLWTEEDATRAVVATTSVLDSSAMELSIESTLETVHGAVTAVVTDGDDSWVAEDEDIHREQQRSRADGTISSTPSTTTSNNQAVIIQRLTPFEDDHSSVSSSCCGSWEQILPDVESFENEIDAEEHAESKTCKIGNNGRLLKIHTLLFLIVIAGTLFCLFSGEREQFHRSVLAKNSSDNQSSIRKLNGRPMDTSGSRQPIEDSKVSDGFSRSKSVFLSERQLLQKSPRRKALTPSDPTRKVYQQIQSKTSPLEKVCCEV